MTHQHLVYFVLIGAKVSAGGWWRLVTEETISGDL